MPLRPSLALALVALSCPGQGPDAWASLVVPGGVAAADILSLGKVVAYRTASQVHAWSAVTRAWSAQPLAASAPLRVFNDTLLAVDGGAVHAFSSLHGRFATLAVGPGAAVLNPTGNNNDSVVLVHDGATLHAFSCFTGAWTTRPVGPAFSWAVQRHVAVVSDGPVLGGYDAFTGTWTDLAVAALPWQLAADGTAALAQAGTTVLAFSAGQRSWLQHALPAGSTLVRGDDWAVWLHANQAIGYSSLQHRFGLARGGATAATAHDLFALVQTPVGTRAFSAVTATWSPVLAAPGATVAAGGSVALLDDGQGVHAYSAVQGRVATLPAPAVGLQAAGCVAAALDAASGRPLLWSGLTGAWHPAPATALPGQPLLTTTSAALATATGVLAFDARRGRFAPLDAPGLAWTGNPSSAPLLAWDPSWLWAFDARFGRWLAVPRAGSGAPQVQIWRTTLLALDGGTAFGFGAAAGRWWSRPLASPALGVRANSESARVHTANELLAFAAVGAVVPVAQFPEFRRVQAGDADLSLVLAVPAAGAALLGFGQPAQAPVLLPGLGELLLAPQGLLLLLVAGTPTGEPVALQLPATTTHLLRGREWAVQAAMLPAAGSPWLTEATTVLPL